MEIARNLKAKPFCCRDKTAGFLMAGSAVVHLKFTRKWRP
jgi:hypothetical protein